MHSLRKLNPRRQYLVSLLTILLAAAGCYLFANILGYRVVALILLVTVSLIAMLFDMKPVLAAAILSALVWNFFFIPPKFTFVINNAEDALMFMMYFVVALVNAVLSTKIRQIEKEDNRREEKENTLRLYNTILNSLSHELRTPISTIIGATDNLQSMADKLSEHNKYELISEISKASIQLNRQVGNLLNMSRLESGVIQPKNDWLDVKELVYDVLNQLKDTIGDKPVHVAVKENTPLFKLDYGLVSQVLHNLVHNAVTYLPKYAVVTIRAFCRENKLVLVVEDTGDGFPEDEIEKVFEKFYRLKNSGTGGTGLGLSIVKGFVTAMKGTIVLKNMSDGGAVFTVEIPSELSYVNNSAT
ncbi:MAG TPA: ATP-binding protein [Bacteroidia bacterium]|nr:ATP-binding protein [Bacteroidia bacterium]